MKPLSKRVMLEPLRWGAALLSAVLVWGPATAHETEKKLGSPGFRPSSARADAFVKAVGSAPITVFPTAVRNISGGTSYDRASQKGIVRFLKDNGLGGGKALDRELDAGKLQGNSQWEAFQAGMDTLGKEVAKAKVPSDYALVVELLIQPDRSKEVAVWGIHCYVLDREGANAFSFLLNSHHKMFVNAALKTQDRSAKGQEKLVTSAVRTAVKALKRQVEAARGADAPMVPLPSPKAKLPFTIYADDATASPYVPSGWMGNNKAIKMNMESNDSPHSGKTCIRAEYNANDDWGGVLWQSPANDWEGEKPGGLDLTGASELEFWARGAEGGEIVNFVLGVLDGNQVYRDTAKGELKGVRLTTEWQKLRIKLEGRDLSRIKTGFGWSLAGQGKPVTFYLDDIRYVAP